MPTFESVGVHPELRSRLVAVSNLQPDADPQLLETPLALLARNPTNLRLLDKHTRTVKPLALPQVLQLRQEVAEAVIKLSRPGKRARRIRQKVPHCETLTDQDEPVPSPAGTRSALDLIRYQTIISRHIRLVPIPTNCAALDRLMAPPREQQSLTLDHAISARHPVQNTTGESGIPFGYVTQFCGPSGCGKTQLCLQIAASTSPQTTTFYLASSGALPCLADRLSTLARHYSSRQSAVGHGHNTQSHWTALQTTRFVHVPASEPHMLLSTLQEIETSVLSEESQFCTDGNDDTDRDDGNGVGRSGHDETGPLFVVILDSVSGCLGGETSNDWSLTVGMLLKRLARHHDMAVVITNGTTRSQTPSTTSSRTRDWKPALGQAWSKIPDIQILLDCETHGAPVHATLDHHFGNASASSGRATFRIDETKGIVSVD